MGVYQKNPPFLRCSIAHNVGVKIRLAFMNSRLKKIKKERIIIMSDKKVFAERLKAKRHEKQMSQAQLARAIQIAPSAISNYERGAVLPDICIVERMSRFLELQSNG